MQAQALALEVGRRISTMLYSRGMGTIVAVYGRQDPASVRVLGGIVHTGGGCEIDVVFDCGQQAKRLPECIARGVQWELYDEMVGPEAVAAAIAKAAVYDAQAKAKADACVAVFKAAMVEAEKAGRALGLMPEAEFRAAGKRGTAAAYNLRIELKKAGIKASVKGDYGSITVGVTDDADQPRVKEIMAKYKAGSFDSMSDCYDYDPSAWGAVFGDVRYVFGRSVNGYCF